MQRRKSFFNNEMEQRFSLRKYTIGLCSVCLGFVTIGMGSQTVKADTVNNVEKSSAVQENKMQDTSSANTASNGAKANIANSAASTETKLDKTSSAVANSNNALAQTKLVKAESVVQPKVNGTSTETKPNEHGSDAVNPNAVSTEVKPNATDPASLAKIKPQETKLVKSVDAKALAESKVATDNQFNFDDWTTQIDDTYLNITGYTGDRSKQIVVPNGADFAKAGKNDKNLQVEIGAATLADLIVDGVAPKLSNTDGQKIVAKGDDWSGAFSNNKNLHDISGLANLDTSNVTKMGSMFASNQIIDLSPLANWNTGKVTDMRSMFKSNRISDLSPLANWNTGNVTKMGSMFASNQISNLSPMASWNTDKVTDMSHMLDENQIIDLSPLANWNIGNVTSMDGMFADNQISDLSPLANWNIDNVTSMDGMFAVNQISDLIPLASWNTSNVTDMSDMFDSNKISDLSPLASWNTGNVTDMSWMFGNNQISDLIPLASWNTGNVTDMSWMFYNNLISDLIPLASWNTGNVTDMSYMFAYNQIIDLSPLANWNTSKVTDMGYMFNTNQISNLSPLANWNTGNVTDMDNMFNTNKISNLSPLANWNTSKVTDMGYMFSSNPDLIDLSPIANWNMSSVTNDESLFANDTKLDLTNINKTSLMKVFLKDLNALSSAIFITNNADLVEATINKDLPDSTNTAKRTITFNIPHATPKTIVQIINYKAITTVQVDFNAQKIIQTYPVKESEWQLDTSKHNDAIIVNGQIHFASVKVPHINGYKAYIVRNKLNPALFTVSLVHSDTVQAQDDSGIDSEIPDVPANPGDDIHQEVKYEAQDQNQTVHYTNPDGTPATNPDGSKVSDTTIIGKTDSHVDTPIPGGWKDHDPASHETDTIPRPGDDGKVPDKNVAIDHDETTVTHDNPANPGDKIPAGDNNKNAENNYTYPNDTKAQKDNLNGTAHRHIIVETPDHKDENSRTSQTIDQTIDYNRDAKVDTVTGEVNSYTPWKATDSTKTSFDEYHVDPVDGYDISVEGATEGTDYVVNKDGSITIKANTPDPTKFSDSVNDFDPTKILPNSTITVKYNAKAKTVTIHYVDDDNNGQPAKDAQDKTINAVTDQNLDGSQLTYDVPSIYHLADNSGEVTTFHVNADDSKNVITVHLKQNTGVPIDPDKIPDGTKNPEDGDNPINKGEFTHDVHRTVTVDYPASYTGEKPDLSQTITLSRTATYNQVTGVVTWSAWSTGKFDAETPVAIAGYTPSVSSIAEMPVTHDTADQTVHITYTAGQQSMTWTFVDDDEGGKTVGSPITLTGDTDTSIATGDLAKNLAIPKNYDLDDTYTNTDATNVNQIPTSFTFHATNTPVTIHLKHHHQDIDATHIPAGAKDKDDQHVITVNDFSKTINRTIEFDTPTHESSTSFNTGTKAQHHDQSVTLQRHGDYDAVTGLVTWKPWSEADFDAVNVGKDGIPTFDGYDIDPDNSVGFDKDNNRIDAMHVTSDTKPSVVIIRYKAQDHKVTYHFVDENGKQQTEPDGTTPIADETVSGKTDDTINTPKLPDGWVLDGDTLDPTVKVPTSDTTVNVKIKHGQVTVTHDNPVKNGDKNVPSEPAKTPDTNPSDATHVDKPGEVDNKGQDQGNKGQGTKTNNNKNDEKSAKPGKKQENGKKHVNAKKPTSKRNVPVHGETVNGKSKAKKNTNSNVRPHAEVKPTTRNAAPKAQVMPAGQHVNAKGQILNAKGQVVGHVDKNAQAVLPQTGEKTTPLAWLGLGLASLATIFGLAGDRKRR